MPLLMFDEGMPLPLPPNARLTLCSSRCLLYPTMVKRSSPAMRSLCNVCVCVVCVDEEECVDEDDGNDV